MEGGEPRWRRGALEQLEREDELLLYTDKDAAGVLLNASSRKVWDLCDGTRTAAEISRELDRRHGLPSGALRGDVERTLERLAHLGVVEAVARDATDWESLAEPRADLADLEAALALFDGRHPGVRERNRAAGRDCPSICGGAVSLRRCYDELDAGCEDAALEHPNIARASEYLARWPVGLEHFKRTVCAFHPVAFPGESFGESALFGGSICHATGDPEQFGEMYSTIHCPVMLAENFVHETGHMKLFALGMLKEETLGLVTNGPEHRYRSPVITDRPRPMTAVVHGVFAYMYVTELDAHLYESERDPALLRLLRERLRSNLRRLDEGYAEIRAHLECDERGERFFAGFGRWMDDLLGRGRALLETGSRTVHPAAAVRSAEPVRVFVGTDPAQGRGETALENSIRRRTRGPVEIVWMDHGRGGPWSGWNVGRERGALSQEPGPGWPTEFSCFRFAIPEVAGFRGRAIYLDVDMLVLRDLRELFEREMERPWLVTPTCPATMLIDCARLADQAWWPRLDAMRRSGRDLGHYLDLLGEHDFLGELPAIWNCHDGEGYVAGETAVLHFTSRRTQPWRPHPQVFDYRPHARPALEELWWRAYLGGSPNGGGAEPPARRPATSRAHPSSRYRELVQAYRDMHVRTGEPFLKIPAQSVFAGSSLFPHVERIRRLAAAHGASTLLDYGAGKGLQYARTIGEIRRSGVPYAIPGDAPGGLSLPDYWGVQVACYDPAYPPFALRPEGRFDGVVCTDVLEHCPAEDVDWIVAELFESARRFVFAHVAVSAAKKRLPNGENAHVTVRSPGWWSDRFARASRSHPAVHFQLIAGGLKVEGGSGPRAR